MKTVLLLALLVSGSLFANEELSFRQFGASCALTNQKDYDLVKNTIAEGFNLAGSARLENTKDLCAYTFQDSKINSKSKSIDDALLVQFGAACVLTNEQDISLVDTTLRNGYKLLSVSNTDKSGLCSYSFQVQN